MIQENKLIFKSDNIETFKEFNSKTLKIDYSYETNSEYEINKLSYTNKIQQPDKTKILDRCNQ